MRARPSLFHLVPFVDGLFQVQGVEPKFCFWSDRQLQFVRQKEATPGPCSSLNLQRPPSFMVVRLAPSERPEGQASLHARQLTKEAILSSNEENSTPTKQPLPGWHLAMAAPCQLGTDRAPWGSEVDQIQRGSITIYSTYIYI